MSEPTYNDPHITLSRIYTRSGDDGMTNLVGGQRIAKDHARIEAYGTVDELNALIGLARITAEEHAGRTPSLGAFARRLSRIQHELFNLGSILATLPKDVQPRQPRITQTEIETLEREIDEANATLPALESFVLPGSSRLDAELHVCRTVCRRAERMLVTLAHQEEVPPEAVYYLNRLSDALFVWGRWVGHELGTPEVLWKPNEAASGAAR